MLQTYLINILIFCGIALLIALTVAVIQGIIILVDIRRTTKEVSKKVRLLTSAVDIVSLILGGLGGAKKSLKKKLNPEKSTLVAFIAGIKKGVQILLKK
jgi:hypothetical protein